MSFARLLKWGIGSVLIVGLLAVFPGCNEPEEFDTSELFSLEDFARNIDYANECYILLYNWRGEIELCKSYLGATPGAIPFAEVVPQGWSESEEYAGWFQRTSTDGGDEYIRFDASMTPPGDIFPVQAEYFNVDVKDIGYDIVVPLGDSVEVHYTNNGWNILELDGAAAYYSLREVYLSTSGGTGILRGAGMYNAWHGELVGVSAQEGNYTADYVITGTTAINDLVDEVILNVKIEATFRANSSGEARIWVDGTERARYTFSGYDEYYRGYLTLADDNFTQRIYF